MELTRAVSLVLCLALVGCAMAPSGRDAKGSTHRSRSALGDCVEGEDGCPPPCVDGEEGCPPVDPPPPCALGEEGCPPVDPPVDPPVCEPEPLALAPLDASALDPAVAAFVAACDRGFAWCRMGPILAYTYPSSAAHCDEPPPSLDQIVTLALEQTAFEDQRRDFSFPEDFDRATLGATFLGDRGPALLDDIDAFAGPSVVEARGFLEELRCHNCHDFAVRYVLHYPETHTVIVVDGGHGYDS